MNVKIESGWKSALAAEFEKPYFIQLTEKVRAAYTLNQPRIYPPASKIFAAFDHTPFEDVKVVIVGQDPYHGPGQANGLSFSVNPGIALPPSLVNIFKEIQSEFGTPMPENGDLTRWADQGVLLLNASLTVAEHMPKSHSGWGWEQLTDAAIKALNSQRSGIVFLLWGSNAIRKRNMIDGSKHLILTSPHPSPLSAYRGFFGNNHFKTANDYLQQQGKTPINW
jgi:uracil-DNA glycosylase